MAYSSTYPALTVHAHSATPGDGGTLIWSGGNATIVQEGASQFSIQQFVWRQAGFGIFGHVDTFQSVRLLPVVVAQA